MSFLGQPNRRRAINLGNKQQSTRTDLIKKAQEERQLREKSRKDSNAAIIRTLKGLESSHYNDNNIFIADFIFACSVLEYSRDPSALIESVLSRLANKFLRSRLLIALNTLWIQNSKCLEAISPFYSPINGADYPVEIIDPLYNYAKTHPGQLDDFFKFTFTELVSIYPAQVVRCFLDSDTLTKIGVDLGRIGDVDAQALDLRGNKPQILYLLRWLVQDPLASAPLITHLVAALPHRITTSEANQLHPLFTSEFISHVLQMHLDPVQLCNFLLPLMNSSLKAQLLLRLTLASGNLVSDLWQAFQQTSTYHAALQLPELFNPVKLERKDWAIFVTMLELYSYWLIVCNDSNVFDALDQEQTKLLAQILRGICYTSCWNQYDPIERHFTSILFIVVRQLYVRSTRRNFLPASFWLISRHIPAANLRELEGSLAQLDYRGTSQEYSGDADDDDADDDDDPDIVVRASPPVEILKRTPFFVEFMTRATIFSQFTAEDKRRHLPAYEFLLDGVQTFAINRENLVEDAVTAFSALSPDNGLKSKLKFTIFSRGEAESGIDGGGLTKEVLTSLCHAIFIERSAPGYSDLFIETHEHTLYPNPKYTAQIGKYDTSDLARRYRFLGQVIGKCLHESLMVDVHFSPFFLQKWAGSTAAKSCFDDFYLLDPDMYSGLLKLLRYDGNVENLALDFTTDNGDGEIIDLKPSGSHQPVTNENRLEYVHLLSNYKLNLSIQPQTRWFLQGVTYFISPNWLRMFGAREIQTLISGESSDFNVDDLRKYTDVNGFAQDKYVDYFWEVVGEMTSQERRALLKFVTSVPQGPLLGFSKLNPRFGLRSSGRNDNRLPTASTCVNLLKLPEYSSKEVLRQKLLYSINSNAGFDLS